MTGELKKQNHVLIVEDSATQAAMLESMIQDLNMLVTVTGNLKDALALVNDKAFDAVMLDLILPDSAGIETLIKLAGVQCSAPIVVLTSLEDETLGFEALKAGADDYLIKGEVSPHTLTRSLRYAIERKRQSFKVYESEKRLRTIIENSYDAFLALDCSLNVVEWNIKAEDMFGFSVKEVLGKNIINLLFADGDSAKIEIGLSNFLQGCDSDVVNNRVEVTGVHRGSRNFHAEIAFFPIDQGGKTTLCTFVSDITNRKEIEQHMADFYSIVAHELRSPLTSIKGSLRVLEGGLAGPLPEKAHSMVAIGGNSCDRLLRLIGDLLDLSKFEAGKMPLEFKEIDIQQIVSQAVQECTGTASTASVSIVSDVKEAYRIKADSDRLIQVMVNLLSNALKFSPQGGTVSVQAQNICGDRVRVSVQDEGPGIPADSLDKLFQKFNQIQANSQKDKGTGLGLAISKAIISHHKGDIGVSSVPGGGATFWLELPLDEMVSQAS